MKSKDTLKWFPAQLPEVRIILGDAGDAANLLI